MIKQKTILFDLDGTLLPIDQDEFVHHYFKNVCIKVNYRDPKKLVETVWLGTACMTSNDGKKSNMEVFYDKYTEVYGKEAIKDKELFDDFYNNEFNKTKEVAHPDKAAINLIKRLKENGYTIVLATNPLFPMSAQLNRIKWAGLNPDDFKFITSYENSSYCKPNTKYYEFVLNTINKKVDECIMVGNDVDEDIIPTAKLGMDNFLITKHMINKSNSDTSNLNKGTFEDLEKYIFD